MTAVSGRLAVSTVESRRDWRRFFNLRRTIYRHNRHAVFPLRFMERTALDTEKHPFYLHARRQAFLCFRDNVVVGRIVAIKDDLHNEFHQDRVGFFGFFECLDDPEAANLLLQSAENWLLRQGCESIRGPVNPSMKSDFGVQVTGNDDPPFVMMACTPTYYEPLLISCGLKACRQFNAYLYDYATSYEKVIAEEQRLLDASQRILKRYPQLRIVDVQRANMETTLKEINELGNRVRSAGWGFVPLTNEELDFMIVQLKKVLRPDMLLVAYWKDQLVGYCVNVPDINSALRWSRGRMDWIRLPQFLFWLPRVKRTRVIALGADEAFRRKGVGILLSTEMKTRGLRSAYRQWEFSWIDSENEASIRNTHRIAEISLYKTYRLYEKPLVNR